MFCQDEITNCHYGVGIAGTTYALVKILAIIEGIQNYGCFNIDQILF